MLTTRRAAANAAAMTLAGAIFLTATVPASAQIVVSGDGPLVRANKELPKGTGLVLGRAVDPGTGRPVAGVLVTLSAVGAQALPLSILTDAMGRFVFRDLPKGSFSLYARKAGYVYSNYGKHLPDSGFDVANDWQPLELGENQHRDDVVIKMWKHAAIGGTVRDERGEPVVGIQVRALAATYSGGRRRYSMESTGTGASAYTDDRGQYRLSALVPGEFIVVVPIVSQSMPRSFGRALASEGGAKFQMFRYSNYSGSTTWTGVGLSGNLLEGSGDRFVNTTSSIERGAPIAGLTSDGRVLQYEMQFHPHSRSLGGANPIRLGSGEERSGIDFQLTAAPTVRVSGRIVGPSGPVADLVLNLIRSDTAAMTSDPAVAQTVTDVDGSFMFIGIHPGDYALTALVTPQPQAPAIGPGTTVVGGGGSVVVSVGDSARALPTEPTLWARTAIVVGADDIHDISITLRRGARVTGRVEFQGAKPATLPSYFSSFYMERADGTQSKNLNLLLGRIDGKGNLASFGQPAGRYFVRVPYSGTGASDYHFAGAMYNGRDLSRTPIELSDTDIEGVVFVFRDRPGATINGSVRAQSAATDFSAAVVVFPTDRTRWVETGMNPRDIKSVGVLGNGRYTMSDLPPGDYFVAAMPAARRDWRDPAVLESLSRGAERVTITSDEQKSVDLTLPRQPGGDDEAPKGHGPWIDIDEEEQTQAPPPRDVRQPAPTGTAIVTGVVVTGNPQEPVRKAIVRLSSSAWGSRVAITDDNGQFMFASLPAGRFTLSAEKAPYLPAAYGAARQGRPGTALTLGDGQKLEALTLRLERGAVISGTIRDVGGEPINGASVQLMRYSTISGSRRLSPYSPGLLFTYSTDDRGLYRFYGVEPGEYLVAATDRLAGGSAQVTTAADIQFAEEVIRRGTSATAAAAPVGAAVSESTRPIVSVPVFYPGTPDVAGARFIPVGVGQEVHGLDFILRPAAAATVRGVVSPATSNVEVRLVQASPVGGAPGFINLGLAFPLRPGPDGLFVFNGIGPGTYSIVATTVSAGGRGAAAPASPQWALREIQVAGVDIGDVVLSLQPAMTVRGRIVFDASTLTPPAAKDVRVSISTLPGSTQVSVLPSQVVVNEDLTFSAVGIMPGTFRVSASLSAAASRGWIVRNAVVDNRDVMDTGFVVKPGEDVNGLTVTYTDRPAELSGVLTDASGRPAADYFIILFAADPDLWRVGARRIQQARPSTDGRFQFSNLPPGKYLLAALTDVAPGEWLDPEFLRPLMTGAIELTIAEGEKKTQNIQIKAQ